MDWSTTATDTRFDRSTVSTKRTAAEWPTRRRSQVHVSPTTRLEVRTGRRSCFQSLTASGCRRSRGTWRPTQKDVSANLISQARISPNQDRHRDPRQDHQSARQLRHREYRSRPSARPGPRRGPRQTEMSLAESPRLTEPHQGRVPRRAVYAAYIQYTPYMAIERRIGDMTAGCQNPCSRISRQSIPDAKRRDPGSPIAREDRGRARSPPPMKRAGRIR